MTTSGIDIPIIEKETNARILDNALCAFSESDMIVCHTAPSEVILKIKMTLKRE